MKLNTTTHSTPSDEQKNKTHCQGASLITHVFNNYTGKQIIFKVTDVCTDCLENNVKSDNIDLLTKEGKDISDIADHYLGMTLTSQPESEIVFGTSCQTTNDCQLKGFDCCSLANA